MKAGDMGVHVDDRLLRQVGLGADQQRLDTQLFNVFAQQSQCVAAQNGLLLLVANARHQHLVAQPGDRILGGVAAVK